MAADKPDTFGVRCWLWHTWTPWREILFEGGMVRQRRNCKHCRFIQEQGVR